MKRFQDGWQFLTLPVEATIEDAVQKAGQFLDVEIPHDWLIENTDKLAGNVSESGWYRKVFSVHFGTSYSKETWHPMESTQEQWILRFDGIYMDSIVYVNRRKACEWKNGYTAFEVNLTPFLSEGENEIFVSVKYETPNSRWYSGAGIYRSVWLIKRPDIHLLSDGIYIVSKKTDRGWQVSIEAEVITDRPVSLRHRIREWGTKAETGVACMEAVSGSDKVQTVRNTLLISDPVLWDLEQPMLYEVVTELIDNAANGNEISPEYGEKILDCQENRFGFRTVRLDPDRGFFLNDRHIKLKGVCEHHDLGGLGAAFYMGAMRRKFEILKQMGANAVRISHNMPARETMELADEMGILIVTEFTDVWERPKNTYDYARFFREWYQKDIASWVRRDRNCPSVILWSIGNEIYDTHVDEHGQEITALLMEEVRKHDPKQNAKVTLASNYMPWENAQKCGDLVKVVGYNYAEAYYEEHHRAYPDWVIYGSETGSVVQSRGVYHFPAEQQILTEDDRQCSSLGNSITSWGARSIEACITDERDTPFSLGHFIWTGFDYIGEPTPYHTKNSYFGQIDTAGFPKDSYYLYQSAWTDYKDSPMIHIYPYWDFNEGQMIDVGICSNAPEVELIVNGDSYGKKRIDHKKGRQLTKRWQVPYRKGEICAVAYDESGKEILRKTRHSFGDARRIRLTPDKTILKADGRDLIFVTVEMEDKQGYPVENANNRVEVSVTGAGRLIGLDNGDSTDYDEYKGKSRRLFSGKLLAIVTAKAVTSHSVEALHPMKENSIEMVVTSPGCDTARLELYAVSNGNGVSGGISAFTENKDLPVKTGYKGEVPVRKIEIICKDGNKLNPEQKEVSLEVVLYPANTSYSEVEWEITDDRGIPSHAAELYRDGKRVIVRAAANGSCRVRCMTRNGGSHISLISQLEFSVSGFEDIRLNPYEFIYGGLYSYSGGTNENAVSNGNERGFATARVGETQVGFENLDFGDDGSDEITVPVFALSGEAYPIQIWEGIPGMQGSEIIADVIYQKPSIWNVYQEETWHLKKRLKGITSICFVLWQKVHIKGFIFKKYNRALRKNYVGEADRIYGDNFTMDKKTVREIGNNVSLEFMDMDFGPDGVRNITICGNSPNQKNSILICFRSVTGEQKQLIEFVRTEGNGSNASNESKDSVGCLERSFPLIPITGVQNVTFLFLPGSRFDFEWFRFEQ